MNAAPTNPTDSIQFDTTHLENSLTPIVVPDGTILYIRAEDDPKLSDELQPKDEYGVRAIHQKSDGFLIRFASNTHESDDIKVRVVTQNLNAQTINAIGQAARDFFLQSDILLNMANPLQILEQCRSDLRLSATKVMDGGTASVVESAIAGVRDGVVDMKNERMELQSTVLHSHLKNLDTLHTCGVISLSNGKEKIDVEKVLLEKSSEMAVVMRGKEYELEDLARNLLGNIWLFTGAVKEFSLFGRATQLASMATGKADKKYLTFLRQILSNQDIRQRLSPEDLLKVVKLLGSCDISDRILRLIMSLPAVANDDTVQSAVVELALEIYESQKTSGRITKYPTYFSDLVKDYKMPFPQYCVCHLLNNLTGLNRDKLSPYCDVDALANTKRSFKSFGGDQRSVTWPMMRRLMDAFENDPDCHIYWRLSGSQAEAGKDPQELLQLFFDRISNEYHEPEADQVIISIGAQGVARGSILPDRITVHYQALLKPHGFEGGGVTFVCDINGKNIDKFKKVLP